MSTYVTANKRQLVTDVTTIYRRYSRTDLFDRFFDYLADTVFTGNLTDLAIEFNQVL
jgi:hypothetical protein